MSAAPATLHELWSLPLEEQQRIRHYETFEDARHYEPWAENAAPDLHRVGPFYVIPQKPGTIALVDGRLPWNNCIVGLHLNVMDAQREAEARLEREKRNASAVSRAGRKGA